MNTSQAQFNLENDVSSLLIYHILAANTHQMHCLSLVDFTLSSCGKSWAGKMEEAFTFQCVGSWKVDYLTAEIARLTVVLKGWNRERRQGERSEGAI